MNEPLYNKIKILKNDEIVEILSHKPLSDFDKERIFCSVYKFILKKAQEYKIENFSTDDLESICSIGIMKAINSFDVSKKVYFSTYAFRCVDNELRMCYRKNIKKTKNYKTLYIDNPMIFNDGESLTLGDMLHADQNTELEYFDIEKDDFVKKFIENLLESDCISERDKKIIKGRYGIAGFPILSQNQLSRMLGISQSYISRLENKIIKNIKKYAQKNKNIAFNRYFLEHGCESNLDL